MVKRFICLCSAFLILTGCSPSWHLKTALKKDPTLLQDRIITIKDTIILDAVFVTDTFVTKQVDTITIQKDKFRVKIFRSYDTLRIEGACDTDTIYRTIEVSAPLVEYSKPTNWFGLTLFAMILTIAIVLLTGYNRYRDSH